MAGSQKDWVDPKTSPVTQTSAVTNCLGQTASSASGLAFLRAFLSIPECNAYKLLALCGVNVERLAETLSMIESLPVERGLEKSFTRAHRLASGLTPVGRQENPAGTEHLLLALLERSSNEPVPLLLNKLGVAAEEVRALIVELPREP